jgi:hypothetical protein
MANLNKTISETNIQVAREYLEKQLDTHSWWPKEQPGLAKQEFKLMQGSAEALDVWCEKWLDSSQLRQLEKKLKKNRA